MSPALLSPGRRRILAGSIAAFCLSSVASAATLTWDSDATFANGSTDGSGTWDTSTANWNNGTTNVAWPNTTADTAVFGAAGTSGAVTVLGTVNVGTLTFNTPASGAYTISGGTLNGLSAITNFNTNGSITTISSDITRTGNLSIYGNGATCNLTLSGTVNLGGGGNLTIPATNNAGTNANNTNGTITLSGASSNTMGLNITSTKTGTNGFASTVTVVLAKTAGALAVSGNVSIGVGNGISRGIVQLGGNEQIPDTATVALGSSGYSGNARFQLMNYNETIAGLNSSSNSFPGGAGGTTAVENGSAVAGTSTLTISGSGTYTYGPAGGSTVSLRDGSTGKLALTKNGTGTQIFSSNVTLSYTGATTVNAGTLSIRGSTLSSSAVTLAGGNLDLQTATINSAISGTSGQLSVAGGGTSNFGGGNKNYSVDTIVSGASTILLQTAANSLSANSLHNLGTGTTLRTGNFAGSVKALAGAGSVDLNGASANLTITDGSNQVFSGAIGGSGKLTKTGSGTQAIIGANSYTGGTTVTGGTLFVSSLGTNGGLTLNGGNFAYQPAAAGALNVGTGILNVAAGSRIGTAVGGTASQSAITSSVAAVTTGAITVDIYGIPGVAPTDGSNNLITAASGLGGATYTLGKVYNATNFTISGGLSSTATAVSITTTAVGALSAEWWKGGFSGGNNVWALSDGTAASNWASDNIGTATSLTPGTGATLNFSASGATNQGAMTLGANMSVAGIIFGDSNPIGLNADGNALTLGTAGITVNSGAGAVTLGAPITLGVAQTWANNGANTLTISGNVANGGFLLTSGGTGNTTLSGALAGTGGLTKTDAGTLTLSGANTFSGGTTINAGTVLAGLTDANTTLGALGGASGAVNLGNTTGSANASLLIGGAFTVGNSITVRDGTTSNTLTLGGSTAEASIFSGAINLGTTGAHASKDITLIAAAGGFVDFQGVFNENTSNTTVAKITVGDATNTGTVKLSNVANAYGGSTTINGGTLEVVKLAAGGSNSSIGNSGTSAAAGSVATDLVINGGTLKFTGTTGNGSTNRLFTIGTNGATIDGSSSDNTTLTFTGTGSLATTAGATDRTLTLTGTTSAATLNSIASAIIDPTGGGKTAVTKSGDNTWGLSGANTYTGPTTVNGGTLNVSGSLSATTQVAVDSGGTLLLTGTTGGTNPKLNPAADVTLNGGKIDLTGITSATISQSVGTLSLSGNSSIDFGTLDGNTFRFANSSAKNWSSFTLSVYDWSAGNDHLFFGTNDSSGLTGTQLGQITFYGGTAASPGTALGTAAFISGGGGELTLAAVPEPSSTGLLVGAALFGLIGFRERRRLGRLVGAATDRRWL